ncbi:Short chain dehydrogenase citE [Pseudocercospora fuligena]|uniref:Short chain dehydrogenase citE n=1 Tax=Pseudocercospora fuligena TaxID=685502 RepID=A0A8H6VMY6_9PEZI|nr:Short chain dehydrogenase citE [Pseudocercospora fuligena]
MEPTYPSYTPTCHHDQYPAIDPSQPSLDCSNKIVLITGGGRGIGKAIATAFAEAHAKGIALVGRAESTLRETSQAIKQISPRTDVFITTADIQDKTQTQAAIEATLAHFSVVPDVLVMNAGVLRGVGSLIDVNIDDFWSAFEINTKGPLIVAQAFLRANRQHSPDAKRTIINVSSGSAHIPYAPGGCAYGTSKLASAKIVEYLHHENPEWNVFNMQPGVVATDLAKQASRAGEDSPRLPAGFAVWLAASPDAKWLNGKFLWANWDINELLEKKEEIHKRDLLTFILKDWTDLSAKALIERARSVHGNAKKE